MTVVSPMPDIESVCSTALREAGVCGGRSYSSIPATPAWPLALVKRLGGTPIVWQRLDAARIQVEVYGNNKSEARDEADAARRALFALQGQVSSDGTAYVTGVRDELGLTWLSDPGHPKQDRYVFAVRCFAHAA